MKDTNYLLTLETKIANLIGQLDTCTDAEVPFIHNQIRRTQKIYREEIKK
jgi:hypothetical protein